MFLQVDPSSGAVTTISTGNLAGGIAYNPADGIVYGLKLGNTPVLYSIDIVTGIDTYIRDLNTSHFILGITIDNTGRCFIIDTEVDGISEIDLATGDIVSSLPAGFTVNYGQDMAYDRETNKIYWSAYNATAGAAQLFYVDFDGGTFNLIGQFSTQGSCFATMTVANPNLPAVPTDFTITPNPNQGLSCSLAWTNPTLTVGGSPLTTITVTENPYTLTGLNTGIAYTAYVQAVCGEDNLSEWSAGVNFITAVACPTGTTPVNAQIGSGTTGSYQIPLNTFWCYSYVQELYTNAELSEQGAFFGNINTVSFQYFYATALEAPIKIYMANVSNTDMTGGWVTNGLTEVYNGTVNFDNTGADNWVDIQLQNQFTYDGASNLLVAVLYEKGSYFGTQPRFYAHTASASMVRHAYRDSGTFDPTKSWCSRYSNGNI